MHEELIRKEDELLRLYGFHLVYDPEDAAEYPKDFPDWGGGEVWRYGRSGEYFTREDALEYIDERMA
jgi:hypothetical protein